MPKKKVLAGIGIAATAAAVCLLGSLSLVPAFAQAPSSTNGTQAIVQSVDDDDVAEAAVKGLDTDAVEELVGGQNELDNDDVAEAAVKGPDTDAVEEQVGE
jgi:hypothetical protein